MKIQVTIYTESGQYRPYTTLIEVPTAQDYKDNRAEWNQRAVAKICAEKKTAPWLLKRYGYTKVKARVYDAEKIKKEKAERYEQIKKERGWA